MTQDDLKAVLVYDPETGVFTRGGRLAGCKNGKGYWVIRVNVTKYQAHRLAWLYMIGSWPRDQIDHINRDRTDNRWANLREATNVQNAANGRMRKNNTSGFKGVHRAKNKKNKVWIAQIRANGQKVRIGAFDTSKEARAAYVQAAQEVFGEYASAGERS